MSLMAGVIGRRPDAPRFQAVAQRLERAVSRNPGEPRSRLQGPDFLIVKIDFGFFGSSGLLDLPDRAAALCGEPLAGAGEDRAGDLRAMTAELVEGRTDLISRARGTFALACVHPVSRTLLLATDSMGARPLFAWVDDDLAVFASALRILEAIPEIPKRMDVRGVAEESAFGYSLGDRTPYLGIRYLRAGELMRVTPEGSTSVRYHRWDTIQSSIAPEPELAGETYRRFAEAVRIRRKGGQVQHAFLSGGLDSRCVVSELRHQGCRVSTYGYGLERSQELAFAEAFAAAAGTRHRRVAMPSGSWAYPELEPDDGPGGRGRMIWTGDGGSVALGHVYLTRPMMELSRSGQLKEAAAAFRSENQIGPGNRYLASTMPNSDRTIAEGMLEELAGYECDDPGRLLFFFLLENDQRRHLLPHFEDLDSHRQEFQVPFFDSEFLRVIVATPVDWCLGHGFYSQVLRFFPPVTVSVPWQTYPGHLPCPLPAPPGLGYQWQPWRSNPRRLARRRALLENTRQLLAQRPFPTAILNRTAIAAAYWLTRLRVRNYEYALAAASVYERYWRVASGAPTDRSAEGLPTGTPPPLNPKP